MRQQAGGRKQQAAGELGLGIPWAYPKARRRAGRQEAAGRRQQEAAGRQEVISKSLHGARRHCTAFVD